MEIGSLDAFDAAVYGAPQESAYNYVREQFNKGWENLTDMGRQFLEERKEMVDLATSGDAIRRVEALARKFRHSWDTDDIKYISDIGGLQQARPTMQRWLMADPVIRELRNSQLINGYSDTYEDWQPKAVGEEHEDFRIATDGFLMETSDGGHECNNYTLENDEELTFSEQVDISLAWSTQRQIATARREDPTSPFNDRM